MRTISEILADPKPPTLEETTEAVKSLGFTHVDYEDPTHRITAAIFDEATATCTAYVSVGARALDIGSDNSRESRLAIALLQRFILRGRTIHAK